ncbi:MAG: hypothetical protein HY678_04815, partial [Chloroflexi bacterium]|nr:hypothetical protein [Chloroflexota bacterium]
PAIVDALAGEGIPAREIGDVTKPGAGIELVRRGRVIEFPRFARDEVARVLESSG